MNICVHASVVPEPFGQVVVEAMLAGVPVIAADGRRLERDPQERRRRTPLSSRRRRRAGEGAAAIATRSRAARPTRHQRASPRPAILAGRVGLRDHVALSLDSQATHNVTSVTIVANDVGPTGGMERVLLELIKGLVAAGDRVTVIARTCDMQGTDVVFHRVRGPSRPFVVAYPWFFIAAGALVVRHRDGLVQATGAIVPNHVDIIAVHFCHRGFRATGGVLRSSRAGRVFRVHARLAAALARLGERLCYRPSRVSKMVAVSRGVADELRLHYPAMASRVVVIPNGVDVERFSPSR